MKIESPDTIDDFCEGEKIPRGMFYKLCRQGKGPEIYYVGKKPYVSPEARRQWRKQRIEEGKA